MDLAQSGVQNFINEHLNDDINALILGYREIEGVSIVEIAKQIVSKNKAKNKIPSWYSTEGLIYPPPLSLEQCSSEETGKFKSSLISGVNALDLTGGAGIDSFYLSKVFENVDYVEKEESLTDLAKFNFAKLKSLNISCHCSSAEDFLKESSKYYDLIYIDPSRRNEDGKVFKLSDCIPDITLLQDQITAKSSDVLIKTSPLLDIQKALTDLKNVSEIIVLGVKNEVKEVLYRINKKAAISEPTVNAINITTDGKQQEFRFRVTEESSAKPKYSSPSLSDFIYEPNNSILKAGAFKLISIRFGLNKMHPNTHLYSSGKFQNDFPGRIFELVQMFPSATMAKRFLKGEKVNIIAKNYPLKSQELKKRLKSLDGGERYLIAARGSFDKKELFYCNRIK